MHSRNFTLVDPRNNSLGMCHACGRYASAPLSVTVSGRLQAPAAQPTVSYRELSKCRKIVFCPYVQARVYSGGVKRARLNLVMSYPDRQSSVVFHVEQSEAAAVGID